MTGERANDSAPFRDLGEGIGGMARRIAALEEPGDGSGAGRLNEKPFMGGQPVLRCQNLIVGHNVDRPR